MKTGKPFFIGFISALLTFATGTLLANDTGEKHSLKVNGVISCEIVVPDEAGAVALFAGKELQRFLSQSLGGEIPLLKTGSGQRTALILGESKQLREAGVVIAKLPRDAFVLKSFGPNILIAGRDSMDAIPEKALKSGGLWGQLYERSTLFAAYVFMERFVGIRFYFQGELGTIVPKHKDLRLSRMDVFEKPDFEVRKLLLLGPGTGAIDWTSNENGGKNLDYYRLRLETKYIPNCHGLARLRYLERFAESHPEYFALMTDGTRYNKASMEFPGQLCFSSGIREEIYKDAEAFLTGKPASARGIMVKTPGGMTGWWDQSSCQAGYFNIMPQDGFYMCKCEKCQAHFGKGRQASSDFIWSVVIDVANRLKENKIPGYITAMAYTISTSPPTMDIPDNVMVMLANDGGPWGMDKGDSFEKESALVKLWTEKMHGRKPWLWNYTNKYGGRAIPNIPASTPKAIGEYYRRMSPAIIGAFLQSDAEKDETGNYLFNYLNHYVFAKVAWKNSTDVDALLKEHHRLMFGEAAMQMEKVFNAFEEKWLKISGKPVVTTLGPTSIPLSDYEIWENVYSVQEIANIEKLFDESKRLAAGDTDAGRRIEFIRERFLNPVKMQRAEYENNRKAINDLRLLSKALADGQEPTLDGKLDEPAWMNAPEISLVPFERENGKNERGIKTAVRALHDAENLYFAFDCEEPEMDKLLSAKRDVDDPEVWRDSSVEIYLNPSGDRDHYYQIIVNADGALSDLSGRKDDGGKCPNWKWNSGAKAAVRKGQSSWSVEIAIPVKNLPDFTWERNFPINFNRSRILAKANPVHTSLFTWSPFLHVGFWDVDNFGCLTFKERKSGNIIKNSSFKGALRGRFLDNWYFQEEGSLKPGESWELADNGFTESGRCLRLNRTLPEKGGVVATQYLPELKPDTDYQLSFSLKIEGLKLLHKDYAGVVVNIWDDKNTWWPKGFYVSDMPWTRQGFRFRTGPNANKPPNRAYIRLTVMDATGSASFGDVKLMELVETAKNGK